MGWELASPSSSSSRCYSERWRGDKNESKPFRVRKVAYDVVLAARGGWLGSAELRKTLDDLDILRRLHSIIMEPIVPTTNVHEMMDILLEDRYWRS